MMNTISNQVSFTSLNPKSFRRTANGLIRDFKGITPGTASYNGKPRTRLITAIFSAKEIEPAKVGQEDRRLLERLKDMYKNYQESDDMMDGMGHGGHFVDRTLNITI